MDRLEWDVKTYFALNGALHDAAVAAWGVKGFYDTARPISMIRYMGGKGQSSDKHQPSYDPQGLPLVPGLIEVITAKTAAPGKRHAALRKHIGEIAIKTWQGNPADPKTQDGGVGWILATRWVPYQKPTFVTPAFSGYRVRSQHVQPGGRRGPHLDDRLGVLPRRHGRVRGAQGQPDVEPGPTTDVPLQWATYYDAADQAGISRLYGGIHIAGRRLRRTQDRVGVRQGRMGTRQQLLRRDGTHQLRTAAQAASSAALRDRLRAVP